MLRARGAELAGQFSGGDPSTLAGKRGAKPVDNLRPQLKLLLIPEQFFEGFGNGLLHEILELLRRQFANVHEHKYRRQR